MKVGITLPQFRDDADAALEAARRAEALGIDGVFVFDHLWPMGQPGRPAISSGPLLGALAAVTSTIHLGTLVARIGLLPDDVLIDVLCGVDAISGGRMVAGIGTGDGLSRAENEAYGIPFEPAEVRRARLATVATAVPAPASPSGSGGAVPRWSPWPAPPVPPSTSGRSGPTGSAHWSTQGVDVTWGGPVGDTPEAAATLLGAVATAGASWAVCAWPDSIELVAEAAAGVR